MGRKYPQKVYGRMRRIMGSDKTFLKDGLGKCYLVRDQTRIEFTKDNNLICSVIMTNPGSYGFDRMPNWLAFEVGEGLENEMIGWGYPDPTMRNIIRAIQCAYKNCGLPEPIGYVDVYNVSNIVCPKGELAEGYHQAAFRFIEKHSLPHDYLYDPIIHTLKIESIYRNSPFIINGFLKDKFSDHVKIIMKYGENYRSKVVCSLEQGWPSHPINWVRRAHQGNEIIGQINNLIMMQGGLIND